MQRNAIRLAVFGAVTALITAGCSGSSGGSSDGGSSGSAVPLVSGTVTQTAGSSGMYSKPRAQGEVSANSKVGKFAESGCTVEARDISTNTLVATATSDADGNYTLTGVAAGTTYRITATCGSNSYSVVASSVTKVPSAVTAADRVATNPRSTVIAAYIVKAILSAVSEAISGLPTAAQNAVKAAIMSALDSVIQTITATIEESIQSGSMAEPTVSQATAVANGLKTANDTTAVDTAITSAPTAPVSVEQAVTGAKNSSVALQACDTALSGTEASCVRAIAKLTYNVLGFSVGLVKGAGAFGLSNDCSKTSTVTGGGNLNDYFPNAQYINGTGAGGNGIPAAYCAIMPLVQAPDRNRGYNDEGKGGGGEIVFTETGDLDGTPGDETGVLTELAKALIGNKKYNLASIDKMLFDHSSNGAGFNARLLQKRFSASAGSGTTSYYHFGSGGTWTNSPWKNDCSSNGHGSGSSPCDPWEVDFDFTDFNWSSATQNASIATAIGAGNVKGLGVMLKSYGGTIPTQAQLDAHLDQGRIHVQHNITGEKEVRVITNAQPAHTPGTNPCWDNDPATACVDSTGAVIGGTRVNLTFGSEDASTKVKPITTVTKDASGAYYMRPYYTQSGFSGVVGFIKVADGRPMRDELMRERAVKIILNSAGECSTNGLPTTVAGCADGGLYNITLDWSSCNGGGSACPGYTATTGAAEITKAGGLTIPIQTYYRGNFEQFCAGTTCKGFHLIGLGNWGNMQPLKFTVTPGGAADVIALSGSGIGRATGASEYNVAVHHNCTGANCTVDGFYFVNGNGAPHVDAEAPTTASVDGVNGVGIYDVAHMNTIADYDTATTGNQGFESVTKNYSITEGPVRNPNFSCEAEPFFVDGNGNGVLDCAVVGGFSQATNGDVSFSGSWEYQHWLNAPGLTNDQRTARQAMQMRPRENAYEFSDPVGTKKLMSTAFNGWFDGAHTLSATTELNALQAFSLFYLFMSSGHEYKRIGGLDSNSNKYLMLSPVMDGDSMGAQTLNKVIGQSFIDFKTN